MIPLVLPALHELNVLVTRPAHQAPALCAAIAAQGGQVLSLPMISIDPLPLPSVPAQHELVILTSSNAVRHGQPLWSAQSTAKYAAIGSSTAAMLKELGGHADLLPAQASSESLLQHALLQTPPASVLLIRGAGGRDLLPTTLQQRGSRVEIVEVYQRQVVQHDSAARQTLLTQWQDNLIDVVIATSVEILDALQALLQQLRAASSMALPPLALLAGSPRIASHAQQLGWHGHCLVSASPEDRELLAALARWHTRARD